MVTLKNCSYLSRKLIEIELYEDYLVGIFCFLSISTISKTMLKLWKLQSTCVYFTYQGLVCSEFLFCGVEHHQHVTLCLCIVCCITYNVLCKKNHAMLHIIVWYSYTTSGGTGGHQWTYDKILPPFFCVQQKLAILEDDTFDLCLV